MPPLQLNERCHITAGPVLRLEGTTELDRHQLRDVLHEGVVAGHFIRVVKTLGKHEVEVSFQGVAKDDGVVVGVFDKQRLQSLDALS